MSYFDEYFKLVDFYYKHSGKGSVKEAENFLINQHGFSGYTAQKVLEAYERGQERE